MKIEDIALNNKYTKWYISLINKAKQRASTKKQAKLILGYVESHHIVPSCIYKNKDMVHLTPREHFVCHLLLTKMFSNPSYNQKMHFALASFLRKTRNQNRIYSSKQYENARSALIIAMTNRTVSEETKLKQSLIRRGRPARNKGKPGKKTGPCSENRKLNISIGRKNTSKIKCEHCSKETDPGNFKQFHGDNCKLNPNIDQTIITERTLKAKRSIQKSKELGTFSKPKPLYGNFTCPHCDKSGTNYGVMMRHHFDRCKSRVSSDILLHS